MTDRQRVERGIYLTGAERYEVRVQDMAGSKRTVTRTVDTLEDARALVVAATKVRESGGSVTKAWDAEIQRRERGREITFDEAVDLWIRHRQARIRASDPTRSSIGKRRVRGLRPSTHQVELSVINCHLRPHFGNLVTTDIGVADVQERLTEMANKGLGVDMQSRVLEKLRQIIGYLGTRRQPDDFPWSQVTMTSPKNPNRKPDVPEKWNGKRGDEPPAVSYKQVAQIAEEVRPAFRIVCWLIAILGLRRGEVMGLDNSDFKIRDGRLWVEIWQQGELKGRRTKYPWVKTDPSHRELPIPSVLVEYLEMYWDRYHDGFRPSDARHPRSQRQLVVTSTGRDTDGSFLEASAPPFATDFKRALERTRLTHEALGHTIRPHTLRKTCSTYLLRARLVRLALADRFITMSRPDGDDADEMARWALHALEQQQRLNHAEFTDADVSAWMGHSKIRRDDVRADSAARITLARYDRSLPVPADPFVGIAQYLDLVVRDEIGDLRDEPGTADTLRVIKPDDPDWVLLPKASTLTGRSVSALTMGIRDGAYQGGNCWFADGDREPPGPRLVIARADVERIQRRNAAISRSEAARRLGVSNNFVDGAIRRGDLAVVERHPRCVYIDPRSVERLLDQFAGVIALVYPVDAAMSIDDAHQRFRELALNDRYGEALDAVELGMTLGEAAKQFGISKNTLGSVHRRRRLSAHGGTPDVRAAIRRHFARPRRIRRATFETLTDRAVRLGLLEKVNHTHRRRVKYSMSVETPGPDGNAGAGPDRVASAA